MKPTRCFKLAATAALVLTSLGASAVPFGSFDPRSMAMGGAGVALGDAATAPLFNPALLAAAKEDHKFAFSLPIGARVTDQDKLLQSVQNFQDGGYVDNFNTASSNYNSNRTAANLSALATSMSTLSTQIATMSDKALTVDGGAALVLGVPSKNVGWAFFANANVAAGGMFSYKDNQMIQDWTTATLDVTNNCFDNSGTLDFGVANSTTTACSSALSSNPLFFDTSANQVFDPNSSLQSTLDFRGAAISEVGLSFAHQFEGMGISGGVTPKLMNVQLFEYSASVNTASQNDINGENYLAKYNKFNFDIGIAKDYQNGWRTGFVIKNVIPYTLDFTRLGNPTGNQITLKPQARVGVSWEAKWATLAMDADLTRNDPAGLDKATQFVSLGGEVRVWKLMQLRAGYRFDMANADNSVASVGLGLGFLPIDIAVAGNQNQIGASAQLAMHF